METEPIQPPGGKGPEDALSFKIVATHSTRLLHTLVTDPGEFYKLFSKEVLTWKFGLILLALGLVGFGAYCLRGHFAEEEIVKIQNQNSVTNRAVIATATALTQKVADAEKSRDEMRQERDKLQLMLAPFEAFAMAKYTNAPIEGRLDLLSATMISLTNQMVLDRPILSLEINGQAVTNNQVLSLKDSRNLRIRVYNLSEATAESVTLDFITPLGLSTTNVVANGWDLMPRTTGRDFQGKEVELEEHWQWVATRSVGGFTTWNAPTVEISTNMIYPVITVRFDLFANRMKTERYNITFKFQ